MNPLTAEETAIITTTDATMAAIITSICFERPTAVNTESKEKTISMMPICKMISQKLLSKPGLRFSSLPLSMSRISSGLLMIKKRPPPNKIRSRPEISLPSTVNSVALKVASHVIEYSSAMRVSIANANPRNRALRRRSRGSRSTRITRNMMLSMPRTISSTASVRNDSQTCGSESNSMEPLYNGVVGEGKKPRGNEGHSCLEASYPYRSVLEPIDITMPLGQAVDFFGLRQLALQQIVGAQSKVQGQGRGNVDRRIGAGENADHQGRGKRVQCFAAEEQQRENHQQGHQLGHQGSRQRLIDGFVDDLGDGELARRAGTLAYAVENDHGIVQRIADHREDRRDGRQIKGHLGEREEPHHADRVVQHR